MCKLFNPSIMFNVCSMYVQCMFNVQYVHNVQYKKCSICTMFNVQCSMFNMYKKCSICTICSQCSHMYIVQTRACDVHVQYKHTHAYARYSTTYMRVHSTVPQACVYMRIRYSTGHLTFLFVLCDFFSEESPVYGGKHYFRRIASI